MLVAEQLEKAASSARSTMVQPVRVLPEIRRVASSLEKVYPSDTRQVEIKTDSEVLFYGESRDLLELLGNLMDNAFKFGVNRVRIDARQTGQQEKRPGLRLSVEDDGPGIEVDKFSQLIQRGVRGDEQRDGHGVGLAIVNHLVESYHGRMETQTSGLGGVAVIIHIPPQ